MIARRQFLQASLSAWAAMALPSIASTLPTASALAIPPAQGNCLEVAEEEYFAIGPRIKVIGVGGGACAAVENMIRQEVKGIEFLCVDSDPQALLTSHASRTILLGTHSLCNGRRQPGHGRKDAEAAAHDIRNAIDGARMLFITAGMGGVTGTGAAPVIARIAREMGIITVGVVTTPFEFEGLRRYKVMEMALAELKKNADTLIVLPNEKLLDMLSVDCSANDAFALSNDLIKSVVEAVVEIMSGPNVANLDFGELSTVVGVKYAAVIQTAKI